MSNNNNNSPVNFEVLYPNNIVLSVSHEQQTLKLVATLTSQNQYKGQRYWIDLLDSNLDYSHLLSKIRNKQVKLTRVHSNNQVQ